MKKPTIVYVTAALLSLASVENRQARAYHHHHHWLFLAPPFKSPEQFKKEFTVWLADLKLKSQSSYRYYIGNIREDSFGDMPAIRFLCIIPSEYYMDSSTDWDQFEVIAGFAKTDADQKLGQVWMSTENYKRRAKGLLSEAKPSPDREFFSLDDDDNTNSRLKDIAVTLKDVAMAHARMLLDPPEPLRK